eukprot:TRINITY_DN6370_c0_g1_i1.p1 TRINITY_DN6370_c0_g1~~TRINITY_DN6370_c0_g1_i1.p1  ORF type:complete len:199 (-),score=50.16 TRINITY_DN6370_c0_g1_i1:239-835(-)
MESDLQSGEKENDGSLECKNDGASLEGKASKEMGRINQADSSKIKGDGNESKFVRETVNKKVALTTSKVLAQEEVIELYNKLKLSDGKPRRAPKKGTVEERLQKRNAVSVRTICDAFRKILPHAGFIVSVRPRRSIFVMRRTDETENVAFVDKYFPASKIIADFMGSIDVERSLFLWSSLLRDVVQSLIPVQLLTHGR